MKKILTLISFLISLFTMAQGNTEIHLFDLEIKGDSVNLTNGKNISNNEGYDNQPSFYDNGTVLFSSTRNNQTDIRKYDIKTDVSKWLTNTSQGSEYSPTRIPNGNDISAVRLDTTGLQLLYRYKENGTSKPLLKEAKVGYHLWYNKDILVTTVLVENRMDLVVSNLKDNSNYTFQKNVGRSLLKIPNTDLVSFVNREDGKSEVKSLDPVSGATESIIKANQIQDFCWLPDSTLIAGMGNSLLKYHPKKGENWQLFKTFTDKDMNSISRITVNQEGTKLALVAEVSPAHIVQKQVDSYNTHDLDAFVNCYAEDVWVGQFPDDEWYTGTKKMRENYASYLASVESTEVKVTARIVIGNKVIDQELATDNGKQKHQVAIYEVKNGKIASMNFIFDKQVDDPETIVQKQLDAYNDRNIDAFLATYTEDVKLFNYPNNMTSEGQEAMRQGYSGFFESTPDLHCEIVNRIVIGNKVIDEEYITANGGNFSAVAIYEVENGKIAKVTFLQ